MKTLKFKLLIFIAIIVSTGKPVLAERVSKKVYHNFAVERVAKLEVENKYGNIFINDTHADSVIVDVDIWVEGLSEKEANKLLDKIDISVRLSGKTLIAKTSISYDFKTRQNFSIDYHISIPDDRDMTVTQRYGNVVMENLTGKGDFEIKYGKLYGKLFKSPDLKINSGYSTIDIEEILDVKGDLQYSKFFIGIGKNIDLYGKYSTLNIDNCMSLIMETRYGHIDIGSIEKLQLVSMYTGTKVKTLKKSLLFENGYGNLSIKNVPEGFESINVDNRYASVNIGIEEDASYYLKGNTRYCKLHHPSSNNLNRIRENTSYEVEGYIGNNKNTPSKVIIDSRYGNVDLRQ